MKRTQIVVLLIVFVSISLLTPLLHVAGADSVPYKWDNVKIEGGGGFVCGIIYNPSEEGLVYARTDMGGAYIRNKQTLEWEPILDWVSPDEWNLLGVESLATDQLKPIGFILPQVHTQMTGPI